MQNIDLKILVKNIILTYKPSSQSEICSWLESEANIPSDKINQSKISRVLKQIGAIKVKDPLGQDLVYVIPKEPLPPNKDAHMSDLVISVKSNGNLIVVHTSPGAASLIARKLDFMANDLGILGTISGDDTIFIAPENSDNISAILEDILNSV